jgi:hypothetical protein
MIYVPSQQLQGRLQTQHSVITLTKFNSILFVCMLTQQPKGQLQSEPG